MLGETRADPRLDLDDTEFNEKLDQDKARLSSAGSMSRRAGLYSTVALGIGALAPGIGGAVAGLGLLGATGGLAFGGIASALSDAHQAARNTGLTSQQLAAQQFSNAVQVQQAQQSVTQARQQAAQNAVTSDQQIQEADMNLAETQRNTAASQVQAMEQVQQAQQGVQSATYSLSEANYSLGQAYEQAREQIVQLNDQLADSKLSVQAASLAVQQAERQEQEINSSAYSTDLDRQQAALAVAQAKQQLTDASDQESAAQYAANQASAQGIDGSQTVIQAKQAQLTATRQLSSAQQAYSDAQSNLTRTELNNQAQLKEARMQASSAREQAAYQQRQDAQAVAQAEQNLSNTIKEQKLQWAAMQSTENQAANKFAADMARLTPAGRGFVNQVLSMKGAFKGLEGAAQTATLPGFTTFLKGAAHLVPQVKSGVTGMGSAISKAFAGFGKELQTPQAAQVLNGLMKNGMEFVSTVLPSVGRAFGAIFDLGSGKGAATGLSNLASGIFDGVAGFTKGLKPYIPQLNDFFTAVGKIAKALGPQLAKDIGGIVKVLDPLAKFLNSKQGQPFIDGIGKVVGALLTVKGLAKILPGELGKMFGKMPGQVVGLVAKPLEKALKDKLGSVFKSAFGFAAGEGEEAAGKALGNGGMSGLISGIGNMLSGIPGKITPIVEGIKNWGVWSKIASGATKLWTGIQAGFNLIMDANPIVLVALAIAGLVIGVVEAYKHFTWFRDGVKDVFGFIKDGALFLWHNVFDPMWQGIKTGAEWLYNHAIKPLWNDWIKPAFDNIKGGVSTFVSAFKTGWGKLEGVFKAPVNFLIKTVYDGGIARLWNDVVGAVGLGKLKLPVIAGLARGGIVPGTDHGRDEVLIAARPEEGVLVPGAVRAIGGAPAVHALNAAHGGGGTGAPGHYSLGGIVSGFLSGGEAAAKAVAALATGNTTAFVNALSPLIGTSASGALGQVMVALPKTLLTDAARAAAGMTGGGSPGGGTLTSQVQSWFTAGARAAGVPASWIPDLEIIGQHESSLNKAAVNLSDSNAAAGDPSRGIMQLIGATFTRYHVPGTSMNIFDPVANIAAAARYIGADYGTVANVPGIVALSQGRRYVGYDSGGLLPPGMTAAVNLTGKPEAVLTADESAAVKAVLRQIAQGGAPGGAAGAPTVTQIFNGPQMPSPEQLAEMERRLSLTLSGG